MLKSIFIKDYALIEKIDIKFFGGLNIITGETGAGKSILIDAMGLILGDRAATDVVRKGAEKSIVEAIFSVEGNKKLKILFEENDLDFSDELIIRREISLKGSNRCFVNDSPVSLSAIKEIGNLLVDLHGQHEHQSLLRTETHIEFVDQFAGLENELAGYKSKFKELNKFTAELERLQREEKSIKEKEAFYEFQLKEIEAVSPHENEDEEISSQLKILENSERLLELTNSIYENLYEGENAINDAVSKVVQQIGELQKIDKTFDETAEEANQALALLTDIASFVRDYKNRIDLDPENLEQLRIRLAAINLLKKKFGGSLSAVMAHRENIDKEISLSKNFDEEISSLNKKINEVKKDCGGLASSLSQKRKNTALIIEKQVVEALSSLGISKAKFNINFELLTDGTSLLIGDKEFSASQNGIDEIEFFISTNVGENIKPLTKVASGGEISRVMLALKTILAKSDKLPLLIFDEIDTGISGRVAQMVGAALKELAAYHQIIAITHLPQIAGMANHHFAVEKISSNGRVTSGVKYLSQEERIKEVAKLMSGELITEASLTGAKELMGIK